MPVPQFAGGLFVLDVGSGHVKGHLGRHPRPGYTEWQGERGTLVHRARGADWGRDLQSDSIERQRPEFGVDPLDVEAMLDVGFPRP